MEQYIQLFILIPLLGFLAILILPAVKEKSITTVVLSFLGLHILAFFMFSILWFVDGRHPISEHFMNIYQSKEFNFSLLFYFDTIAFAYMAVSSILVFLVVIFNKFYLHRDHGFKRFFAILMLFYLGLNFIVFSGNFETIFVGWEIFGITSFLLIGYYRDRFLPVKNAFKVLSIYRLGDISMLIAIWLCHHLLHENITYIKLGDSSYVTNALMHNYGWGVLISILFLLAAMIKSAQFPFSTWLPRAMEGPTTSSAIFYGSVAVHLGVFLLLRTYPLWEVLMPVKVLIIIIGFITALVASSISNVQPTVKTQIAYSSIAQIGLIFVEVALGFHVLAMVHFAGNAFLRSYQLLVSPSVLSYLIHHQFFHFEPKETEVMSPWKQKLRNTLFILSVKEWNLDFLQFKYLWRPFKWLGNKLHFLDNKIFIFILGGFYVIGLSFLVISGRTLHPVYHQFFTMAYSVIGVILVLKAFVERGDAKQAWSMIVVSQLFVALSISMNENIGIGQIVIFLSGTIFCGVLGYLSLIRISTFENNVSLHNLHGHIYEHPKIGLVFLIASLGLAGFPFTPTFLGIDLIFTHIHPNQILLVLLTSVSYVFIELAVIRIYTRVFLGPHIKNYHEIAYKTS